MLDSESASLPVEDAEDRDGAMPLSFNNLCLKSPEFKCAGFSSASVFDVDLISEC
jgi:hypothetical protein